MPEMRRASELVSLGGMRLPIHLRLLRRSRKVVRGLYLRRKLARLGARSDMTAPCYIVGGRFISVGNSVWMARGARLEALGPDQSEPKICIGDGCRIHPGLHVGAVKRVQIGQRIGRVINS